MHSPYISTSFLRGFSSLVLARGGNPSLLYRSVDLEYDATIEQGSVLDKPTGLLIPFEKFVYLLENAAQALTFPDIAMQLAKRQDMMILAPVVPMLKGCTRMEEVLANMIKYLKILVSGYQVEVAIGEAHVTLSFTLDLPHIQELVQYQDYAMASAVSIIHGLLGKNYPIRGCYFLREENDQHRISEYARYYGCPVAFGCEKLSISADRSILDQDVDRLVRQINARVHNAISYRSTDLVDQVSQVISFSLANGRSNIKDIAASMNLSERTLQRSLQQHNTSYRALLDAVRFNMANQYLENTYYRMTDIALLLGYSNLSAFTRSYQRWSGVNPTKVRKR